MAGGELVVELSVEPKLAEIGGRVCIKWTGAVVEHNYIGLFPSGDVDDVSLCLEKRQLSLAMCEEQMMMWTLHRAIILQADCFNLCFKLWDNSKRIVATSNTVKVHRGRHRNSNSSTSSADAIREHRAGSDDDDDAFKRYEQIRRTLSHSRRRYSTIQRKHRAKKEALKQSSKDNVIVASGNYQASTLPHRSKKDDMEASLMLDRDSSAQADREMAELDQTKDQATGTEDDSVKASKLFSAFKRANTMDLEQRRKQLYRRYRNVSEMRRGTSLRVPSNKEKKKLTQSLTVYGRQNSDQLNGQNHKFLSESLSAVTIQSLKEPPTREVSVDDHTDYQPPVSNDEPLESFRPRTMTGISPATEIARTNSMENLHRSSSHRSSAARSLSYPVKDDKTVSLLVTPVKEKKHKDEEFDQLRDTPALQFLTRKDLYKYMTNAGTAAQEFFANRAIMELVQRIRKDPTLFLRYQHSRHLVAMLNTFADATADLPDGWERKLSKEGKAFFINHRYKITTFIDPRLPVSLSDTNLEQALIQQRKRSLTENSQDDRMKTLPRNQHPHTLRRGSHNDANLAATAEEEDNDSDEVTPSSTAPQGPQSAYNDLVVTFLRRPDIFDLIPRRFHQPIMPDLRALIEAIQMAGTSAMDELASRPRMLDLAIILSLFDREINNPNLLSAPRQHTVTPLSTERRAFEEKLSAFRNQLDMLGFAQSARIKFYIRRDHLLEDAFEQVIGSRIRYLQRRKLDVVFVGEEGLDYGGPSREYFFLLSHDIFNPYYGLFEYSAANTYTAQVSPTSSFIENNLDWFKFAGRLIGHAIAQGYLLDVFFTRPFYKALLNQEPSLKDLESVEPEFHSSLQWILDNDPEPLDLTFVVEEEAFGELVEKELKADGMDIPVMEDNKMEYIDLMVKWRMDRGVSQQMNNLVKGFREIIPLSLVKQFDAQELEFVIAGTVEVDIGDWRTNTEYRNGYYAEHPTIKLFWEVVENFSNEQRLRLLQFVTGTSSMPFEGFKALKGSNGPKLFTIDNVGEPESLPRSHTCFNRLDLPPYENYDTIFEKLVYAVEEGASFGIE